MPRTAFYTALAVFFTVLIVVPHVVSAQEIVTAPVVEVKAVKSYIVENIEVDVTADNAVEARERAFEEAQVKGYEMLAKRFLSEDELKSFKKPDIDMVSNLVKDYEVTKESLSAVRYKGVYKIRYSKRAFQKNESYQTVKSGEHRPRGDLLILPFYQANGSTFLWQVNPFLDAWVRARATNSTGRAIVPRGDVNDVSQVRNNQALNYDPAALNAMRLRYKAKDVALMIAKPEALADGSTQIHVELYKTKPYGPELIRQVSVKGYRGEMQEQRYNRVVSEVQRALGSAPQRQAQTQTTNNLQTSRTSPRPALEGPVANLMAQLNFNSVREWVEAKRSVERAYGVSFLQVKSLSPRNAVVDVHYQGGLENLRNALQQQGIRLNEPQGDAVYELNLQRHY